eukprot:scaffold2532_cov79-Skeletonema_menzelii.AAC.11
MSELAKTVSDHPCIIGSQRDVVSLCLFDNHIQHTHIQITVVVLFGGCSSHTHNDCTMTMRKRTTRKKMLSTTTSAQGQGGNLRPRPWSPRICIPNAHGMAVSVSYQPTPLFCSHSRRNSMGWGRGRGRGLPLSVSMFCDGGTAAACKY